MHDGLWTIEFLSTLGRSGKGVVVLVGNRFLGGDAGYYYSGTYSVNDNTLTGTVNVTRFDINNISVFGDIGQISLELEGTISGTSINGKAWLKNNPNMTVKIICTKKEDI